MILWINPYSGVSGDMLLGALLDLGAPLDGVRRAIAATGLTGWELLAQPADRAGIRATRAVVTVADDAANRRAGELLELIARARPQPVATLAHAAVSALAEVEARIHGTTVELVHLHELGGHDTVVDTVGVAAALHLLEVEAVYSGPLWLGVGEISTAHGLIPAPAPATLELVEGMTVVAGALRGESVTPTGAALLRAAGARFESAPALTVVRSGYGAGGRDVPGRPNVLPVTLGRASPARREPMTVVETTVDDVTGEVLGHLVGELRRAGAADVWITAAVGKKNRPVHVVSVLCGPARVDELEALLLAETASLGARRHEVSRTVAPRHVETVAVGGVDVRIKVGPAGRKPEHDDLVRLARVRGTTLRRATDEVLAVLARAGRDVGRS